MPTDEEWDALAQMVGNEGSIHSTVLVETACKHINFKREADARRAALQSVGQNADAISTVLEQDALGCG